MSSRARLGLVFLAFAAFAAAMIAYLLNGLRREGKAPRTAVASLPAPGSPEYAEMVGAFYGGVTALDVDANENARQKLDRATKLVPGEPAAWANLGLLEIRARNYDAAISDLVRARDLAPESGAIERLLGLLESQRGTSAQAIEHLRKAVVLGPGDLKARAALAEELEREAGPAGGPETADEPLKQMDEILKRQPDNLFVLLERARLAAKKGDAEALRDSVERIGRPPHDWPAMTQRAFDALKALAPGARETPVRVVALRNTLAQQPAFRQGANAVKLPPGTIGEPIRHFLKLTLPKAEPAEPDEHLAFTIGPISEKGGDGWNALIAAYLTGQGPPSVLVANARELKAADGSGAVLAFPGGGSAPSPHGILAVDLNSDYRLDLVLAGSGGLKLYQQKDDGGFVDVTEAAKLDAALAGKPYFGAWVADVEMDGDLDLVLGAREGPAVILRNNGDGTFRPIAPFEGLADLRDFAWADLDGDGDPDAIAVDAKGAVRIFANERAGRFRAIAAPAGLDGAVAVAVADINADGTIDGLILRGDGTIHRVSAREDGRTWESAEVVKGPSRVGEGASLFAADVDNNGAIDFVAAGASDGWIGLGGEPGRFKFVRPSKDLRITAVADLNGDGRLDLAGLDKGGRALQGAALATNTYHWQVIRPKAQKVYGDGRINAFGVGGEVEVRAGLLVQRQVIAGPVVHYGLGDHKAADVARIVWPNGTSQGEFDIAADKAIIAEQRLKGSCPFLYAFNGTRVEFVTDAIWRSPLGLRINAQETAGSSQTEDWVKVRGDQLAAKDGQYDVRVTAELWETHYWDGFALLVVDHPKGTEVFVDERFSRELPRLAVHATGPLLPIRYARDDVGNDVTKTVSDLDGRHLDTFGRGPYQGVTRDHWVEVEIGDDVPQDRPLVLVAQGWIHPTDSSINVALAQGGHGPPRGLSLEVATSDGKWSVARPDLGFPAGKNKTILVDLDGVFRPGAPRRLRLRTNLEVFWDRLAVAAAAPVATLKTTRLAPASAELRYRGFSRMTQADASSPELPDYNAVDGTAQRWRDLVGHYTRFGDVRELIQKVDDRYVIANAGDELTLRFDAPPGPEAGRTRDFVFIGDGWNKDGDYNTAFSKTVLPLPSHSRPAYDAPPGELEDDPVYRTHAGDWSEYHTRFITPESFQRGLRPAEGPEARR